MRELKFRAWNKTQKYMAYQYKHKLEGAKNYDD